MNKNNQFLKIYLESIQNESSSWKDSLGGKIISGIGSLFKGGAKVAGAAASGIGKAATSGYNGISGYIKQKKTKEKIEQSISNIKKVYDPDKLSKDDIKSFLENKNYINYVLNSAKDTLPANLLNFLQIFKTVGNDIYELVKENPKITLKSEDEIRALINQSLLQKIQSFKESVQASIVKQNIQDFTSVYYQLIMEAKKQNFSDLNQLIDYLENSENFSIVNKDDSGQNNIIKLTLLRKGQQIFEFLETSDLSFSENASGQITLNNIDILNDQILISLTLKQNKLKDKDGLIYYKIQIQSSLKNQNGKSFKYSYTGIVQDIENLVVENIKKGILRLYNKKAQYGILYKAAINNNFQDNGNGTYKKQFSNKELEILLKNKFTDPNDLKSISSIFKVDKLLYKVKIVKNKLIAEISSQYNPNPQKLQNQITDYNDFNNLFVSVIPENIKSFYINSKSLNSNQKKRKQKLQSIKSKENSEKPKIQNSVKLFSGAGFNNEQTNVYTKQISGTELKDLLTSYLSSDLADFTQIIDNDKIYVKIIVNNDKFTLSIKSDYNQTPILFKDITVPAKNNTSLLTAILAEKIKDFYTNKSKEDQRVKTLNSIKKSIKDKNTIDSQYEKVNGIQKVLKAGNDSITQDIKWKGGIFGIGSFKKVLREISMCKLPLEDIIFLAKVFFQSNLLK